MVLLHLVEGKKGPNDVLVLVEAYTEPLTFAELLFILRHYFESEHSYYPVSEGNLGKGMLLSAISCVAVGVPLETILKRFKLSRKRKTLNIIDKRKRSRSSRVLTSKTKLAEVIE